MKRELPRPRAWLASFAIAGGLVLVAPSVAQGIEVMLGVPAYQQANSNWCWAAATQSIVRFQTGKFVSQCQLVKDGTQSTSCPNVGGSKANVGSALNANGVNRGTEKKLDWATVVAEMKGSRPVYSSIIWKTTSTGHAHVIRGYYDTGYSWGVSYIDPASGTITSMEWGSYVSNSRWSRVPD
jgi:hypothetical protein